LGKRENIDDLLEDPKAWDKFNISLKDYIAGLSLSQDEIRYLQIKLPYWVFFIIRNEFT